MNNEFQVIFGASCRPCSCSERSSQFAYVKEMNSASIYGVGKTVVVNASTDYARVKTTISLLKHNGLMKWMKSSKSCVLFCPPYVIPTTPRPVQTSKQRAVSRSKDTIEKSLKTFLNGTLKRHKDLFSISFVRLHEAKVIALQRGHMTLAKIMRNRYLYHSETSVS